MLKPNNLCIIPLGVMDLLVIMFDQCKVYVEHFGYKSLVSDGQDKI